MFDSTSRYYAIPEAVHVDAGGGQVLYKTRRFLPRLDPHAAAATVRVKDGDRLDLIAARLLGNPLLSWRIADANAALDPDTLVRTVGSRLRVPESASR
jgi:hypothetical protein